MVKRQHFDAQIKEEKNLTAIFGFLLQTLK